MLFFLSNSDMFISEFELNYSQFYINFSSEYLSQIFDFPVNIHEQVFVLDLLFKHEKNNSDFDNWELISFFNIESLFMPFAQTQAKNNESNDHD